MGVSTAPQCLAWNGVGVGTWVLPIRFIVSTTASMGENTQSWDTGERWPWVPIPAWAWVAPEAHHPTQ